MKKSTRKTACLSITGLVLLTAAAACGSDENGGPEEEASDFRFEDTATFNEAEPDADSIEGPDLSTLGDLPELGDDVKIGVLIKSLTNQYWQEVESGLNQATEDFGVEVGPIQSAQNETNAQEQLQICETMLLEGYDAIIVSPQTTSNLTPCIADMMANDIPVINIAAPGEGLVSTVYVGSALVDDGRFAGDYLNEVLPAGSEVAEIQGLPGSSAADLRTTGFNQAIENSDLELVSTVAGDWDSQRAFQLTQDLLSRYPDLGGIYAANDSMAVAVGTAAAQSGRSDLVVAGTDGVPIALDAIRDGSVAASVTPFPYYQGYWALESAVRLLGGQDVPFWVETPNSTITSDNVDDYFEPDGSTKPGTF